MHDNTNNSKMRRSRGTAEGNLSKKGSGMSATQTSKHTERGTASATIETQFQLKVHSIHYRVPRKDARRFALSLCSGLNFILNLLNLHCGMRNVVIRRKARVRNSCNR